LVSNKNTVVLRLAGALLTVGSIFALPALAQGDAVIMGTVIDASTKQAVPDVVVTATSPALQGEQIVVTDSTGLYRIPQLSPGVYTIRLEKESYKPFSRGEINLRAGTTTRVNIDLLPEALQATTEVVVGRPPTVDVGSSTTGTTVGQDFVKNIAVARPGGVGGSARSFESLALTTPQATGDAFGVGISGATSAENTYQVDGMNVNNSAYGINGSPLSIEFIDEVNVVTGGYMPEYGRSAGGTVSATTKSGGNEFHGEIYGNLSPGLFNGTPKAVSSSVSLLTTKVTPWNIGDFGAQLGGYIVKDKLWFFAAVQPSFSRYAVHVDYGVTELNADGTVKTDPTTLNPLIDIVGKGSGRFADDRIVQYIGKLTYLFNQDTRLSLTVSGTPEWSGGNGSYSFYTSNRGPASQPYVLFSGPFDAVALRSLNGSNDVTAKLASSFLDKRLLLDVSLGWHHQYSNDEASDGSEVGATAGRAGLPEAILTSTGHGGKPYYIGDPRLQYGLPGDVAAACTDRTGLDNDPTTGPSDATVSQNRCGVFGWQVGGPGYMDKVSIDNYEAKAVLTYLLTAGGHHVIKAGGDVLFQSYDVTKGYSGGAIYTQTTPNASGPRWNISRAYAFPTDTDGNAAFQLSRHTITTTSNFGAFLQDSWSILDLVTLNAGVRYDTQQIYDASGRLAMTLNNQWSPRVGLIYDFTQAGRSKLFANYARYVQGVPLDLADRALSGEKQIGGRVLQNGTPACDPTTGPCTLTAGNTVPRVFTPTSHYITQFGFDPDTVDPDLQPMTEDEFVGGGEYEVIANGRVGATYTHRFLENIIEDMSNDNVTAFIGNPGRGIAKNFGKPQRDYDAVTVYFNKSFADQWLGQVSYTYSRLFCNYPGLFQASNGQLDPGISSAFDLVPLLANRTGPLDGDITHSVKAYLAKDFVLPGGFDINIGGSYTGASGPPTNYLGYNDAQSYGGGEVFILPRGSGQRLPWLNTIDGRIAINYKLSKDSEASISLDVFNIFNFQQVTAVDEEYTLDPNGVLPIPGGKVSDLPGGIRTDGPPGTPPYFVDPAHPTQDELDQILNPNFGHAIQYQAPRTMRIGVKVTF